MSQSAGLERYPVIDRDYTLGRGWTPAYGTAVLPVCEALSPVPVAISYVGEMKVQLTESVAQSSLNSMRLAVLLASGTYLIVIVLIIDSIFEQLGIGVLSIIPSMPSIYSISIGISINCCLGKNVLPVLHVVFFSLSLASLQAFLITSAFKFTQVVGLLCPSLKGIITGSNPRAKSANRVALKLAEGMKTERLQGLVNMTPRTHLSNH